MYTRKITNKKNQQIFPVFNILNFETDCPPVYFTLSGTVNKLGCCLCMICKNRSFGNYTGAKCWLWPQGRIVQALCLNSTPQVFILMCMCVQIRARIDTLCRSYPLQVCAHGQRTHVSGYRVSRAGAIEAESSRSMAGSHSESTGQNGQKCKIKSGREYFQITPIQRMCSSIERTPYKSTSWISLHFSFLLQKLQILDPFDLQHLYIQSNYPIPYNVPDMSKWETFHNCPQREEHT